MVVIAIGFHLGRYILCPNVSSRKVEGEGERKIFIPTSSTSTDLPLVPLPPAAGLRVFFTSLGAQAAFLRGALTGVIMVVVLVVLDLLGVAGPASP